MRTGKYELGIKHGQGIKRGLPTGYKIRSTDYPLSHFGLESGMVFERTTGAYMNGRIYRFNSL